MKKEADITELEKGTKAPSLWDMFLVFSKIGAFTIGGGYAMIPLIRDELVKRGWISDEELPDIIALAQSAPGVLAVNMSIFSGYRMRGVKGSIAATIGSVLPSFITILDHGFSFSNEKTFSGTIPIAFEESVPFFTLGMEVITIESSDKISRVVAIIKLPHIPVSNEFGKQGGVFGLYIVTVPEEHQHS